MTDLAMHMMDIAQNSLRANARNVGIDIEERSDDRTLTLRVTDDGKGMSRETVEKLVDPFFTTRAVGKGSGLGLSISYGIIEKHHGRIEVESELGRGTRFRIGLPVRQPGEHLMEGGD